MHNLPEARVRARCDWRPWAKALIKAAVLATGVTASVDLIAIAGTGCVERPRPMSMGAAAAIASQRYGLPVDHGCYGDEFGWQCQHSDLSWSVCQDGRCEHLDGAHRDGGAR